MLVTKFLQRGHGRRITLTMLKPWHVSSPPNFHHGRIVVDDAGDEDAKPAASEDSVEGFLPSFSTTMFSIQNGGDEWVM